MDAARLIAITRFAIAAAREERAVVAEAWEAHALVEAVVGRLAMNPLPGVRAGSVRAVRLTSVRRPDGALRDLLAISGEAGVTLVALARSTEELALYWSCIEAADAIAEAADQVRALLELCSPGPGPP
jgi:hypothetical protein